MFSYNRVYKNDFTEENFLKLNPNKYPKNIIWPNVKASEQYKILLKGNRVSFTPSSFYHRQTILDVGLVDEDMYSEDYQLFLKLTKKGYTLNFMEKETVLYRQHVNASNNTTQEYILKPHYFKTESFRKKYIYPNISKLSKLEQKFSWNVNQIFKINLFNKKNKLNSALFYCLNNLINPFKYLSYFKNKLVDKDE